eukprot:CAMPEP_0202687632 /NCGR_PEP_ID=MMETSP1385-20130828/3294_1 /ASSEMBLY_ACC=CAM_ASM_000861 /TAXON_ID=933848 /ORGANISM="Elphidium margaritaceum" /LENGTH=762 /DNA_ID=CAMNT_0049342459 /DNA_START=412 /DNA_END=2700 /DNA_ORIENTATION=+
MHEQDDDDANHTAFSSLFSTETNAAPMTITLESSEQQQQLHELYIDDDTDDMGSPPALSPNGQPLISRSTRQELLQKKVEIGRSAREQLLERKRERTQQRRQRRRRKQIHWEKLPEFSKMYVSDNPYYLDKNLVIVGQLHNAELHLPLVLAQLESVACLFNSTTFILFESNSDDNTPIYLQEFRNRSVQCDAIKFNPTHDMLYGNISSAEELLAVYKDMVFAGQSQSDSDSAWIYDTLASSLRLNDTDVTEIDVYEVAATLQQQMIAHHNATLSALQMEELLYEILTPLKFVRYHSEVARHSSAVHKRILTGDKLVQPQLDTEQEILRQLRIFDGVNEFHSGYAGYHGAHELQDSQYQTLLNIRGEYGHTHKLSDFASEFDEIHSELDRLIANDEDILHQKLREKQLQFAQKRKELRERRQRERNADIARFGGVDEEEEEDDDEDIGDTDDDDEEEEDEELKKRHWNEYYSRFRDKLYRIERFVVYRNMLLDAVMLESSQRHIDFDYMMVVDLDIYNIDVRTLMHELWYTSDDVEALCVDGMDWAGYTRDTFATVNMNGAWLHYGHDASVNRTHHYVYDNTHALEQRTKIPHQEWRFERVKSCFGGVIVYNNQDNRLFDSECRYTLTRDIFWTSFENELPAGFDDQAERQKNQFEYDYTYWLHNRHHNTYSDNSKYELNEFRKQYIEILQQEDTRIIGKNRPNYPKDGDICEHIPFHYCLNDHGYNFAISSRAKLYYDQNYPAGDDTCQWPSYFEQRPKFTM